MSHKFMFSSLALLGVAVGGVLGQTVVNPQQRPGPQTQGGQPGQGPQGQAFQGRQTQGQDLDQAIAGCLLLANEEEIALAKFAQGKAQSDQVKEFAQMLADDHRQVVDNLQGVAPHHAQAARSLGEGSQQQTTSATNRPGAQQGGSQDKQMFEMARQTTEECLQLTKQMLDQEQGEDFDKAFMGSQVVAHIGMLAKLRAAESFASPQMQPIIAKSITTTEQHLEKAKEMCKTMKDKQGQGNSSDQASN
jgi:predicted outer membrane protein